MSDEMNWVDDEFPEIEELLVATKYKALQTIVIAYLQHAAEVYKATVSAEGAVTDEARPYGINPVELAQVISVVKKQLEL